jgi:redox-sensing transcriptional repressor
VKKDISQVVIKRMPRYYRYLRYLMDEGKERISSAELSDLMNVTASQIRQDLNNFGGFGQQGYGYNVKHLHDEIGKILGLDKTHNLIIIGGGNLGRALATTDAFSKHNFYMTAIFDCNEKLKGTKVGDIVIRTMDELDSYYAKNRVDMAVLTIPAEHAQEVADRLVKLGVKAIWNFAQLDLEVPDDVVVQNVHLSDSLMRLSLNMLQKENKVNTGNGKRNRE